MMPITAPLVELVDVVGENGTNNDVKLEMVGVVVVGFSVGKGVCEGACVGACVG